MSSELGKMPHEWCYNEQVEYVSKFQLICINMRFSSSSP
jgi:hypothetical protein